MGRKKSFILLFVFCFLVGVSTIGLAADQFDGNRGPCPSSMEGGKGGPPPDMKGHMSLALSELVASETISQEQADKLIAFFEQKAADRKADMGKYQGPPPDGVGAPDGPRGDKPNADFYQKMINDLMAAGELSAEQAQAVENAIRPPHRR